MPERQPSARPYRAPIGVPSERSGRWALAVSVIVHAVIILLLLAPLLLEPPYARAPGARGVAGGGGGGGGGRGTVPERVHYMQLQSPRAPTAPAAVVKMPPAPVPLKPVVTPPVPVENRPAVEAHIVAPMSLQSQSRAPSVVAIAAPPGAGAGADGTSGAGPGSGGGTGTGVGGGQGSAMGPGTGGSEGTVYPATPDFAVIPPLPVPKQLQGKTVELRFTLDAMGRVVRFEFDPTGDSGYDRQLQQRMEEFHFRPAHWADGTAVPSVFVTQLVL